MKKFSYNTIIKKFYKNNKKKNRFENKNESELTKELKKLIKNLKKKIFIQKNFDIKNKENLESNFTLKKKKKKSKNKSKNKIGKILFEKSDNFFLLKNKKDVLNLSLKDFLKIKEKSK